MSLSSLMLDIDSLIPIYRNISRQYISHNDYNDFPPNLGNRNNTSFFNYIFDYNVNNVDNTIDLDRPVYTLNLFEHSQKNFNFNSIYSKTDNCQECPICLKTNENDEQTQENFVKTKKCQHTFHEECLKKWFTTSGKFTCPVCREICLLSNFVPLTFN